MGCFLSGFWGGFGLVLVHFPFHKPLAGPVHRLARQRAGLAAQDAAAETAAVPKLLVPKYSVVVGSRVHQVFKTL